MIQIKMTGFIKALTGLNNLNSTRKKCKKRLPEKTNNSNKPD